METLITLDGSTRVDIRITKGDPYIRFTIFDEGRDRTYKFHLRNLLKSFSYFPKLRTMGVNGNTVEMVIFAEDKICQIRIKLVWKDVLGYEPNVLFRITLVADARNVFTIFENEYVWKKFEDEVLNDFLLFWKP